VAGRGRRDGGPLRRRAARRAQPPVEPVEPLRPPELEEREAYLVLDAALQAGEVLLSGGGGASDVTASTVAFANACGLAHVDCDITFTSITLTWVRAPDVAPVTSMRLVHQRELDYTRVTEVHNVVADVVAGRTDLPAARHRLELLRLSPHPYRRWAVASARALLSAAVVVLFGGGAFVTLVAFGSTVGIDRVTRRLERRSLPMFFTNAVGAFLATAVALGLVAGGLGVRPSLVVAGGIILLLPGSTLVGAVQDAITGYYVTASARAAETLLLTAGIVSGVAMALELGGLLGVSADLTDPPQVSVARLPLQVLAAGAAAAAFAAANYAPRRTLPTSWLAGALAWLALVGATQVGMSLTFASAVAAGAVGACSYLLARRQQAPPVLYLAAGIIPLLPGLTIYRGMLRLSDGDAIGGIVTLANAATLGLALAAGALLGEMLAQPARRDVPRSGRRRAGPWLVGPLRRSRRTDA
jgi:uncharacterized membrane protein YjjP (DUF1212 family)